MAKHTSALGECFNSKIIRKVLRHFLKDEHLVLKEIK